MKKLLFRQKNNCDNNISLLILHLSNDKYIGMAFQKHPLMILLGINLIKDRWENTDIFADKIGCAGSTYRLAESGSINLNPALSLNLARVFEYEYSSIMSLLVAIHTSASSENIIEMKNILNDIGAAQSDNKISTLLEGLDDEFWEMFLSNDIDQFKNYLKDSKANNIFRDFLKSPTFGKTIEEVAIELDSKTDKLIMNLPTLYFDWLDNYLEQLDELPIRIRFADLKNWETKNSLIFKSLYAVVRDYEAIISKENLAKYRFDYLRMSNFHSANFCFLTDKKEKDIKEIFRTNLQQSLTDEHLITSQEFEKIFNKINIKSIKNESTIVKELLMGKDLNNSENEKEFDGFWVFERNEKKPVSFLALLSQHDTDYPFFNIGYSLNLNDTINKQKLIREIWKK